MSEMNSQYINAFLVSASSVFQSACGISLKPGKPYVKTTAFDEDTLVIAIGVTGQIGGQVILALHGDAALEIASKMCMMTVSELDELSLSALSELGNMILGNAATVLSTKGVVIDITPPTIIRGNFRMERLYAQNICIPMTFDGDRLIEVDVSVKEV